MKPSGEVRYTQSAPAGGETFKTFEDLEVYRAAREFRKAMYGVSRRLPDFEKYELASQIRRAAVSLTNNIAEGHGRYHFLDQIKFDLQARGSLEELLDDLNVCEDETYLTGAEVGVLRQQGWRVHQILNGWIRWLRQRQQGTQLVVHDGAEAASLRDLDLDDLVPGSAVTQPSPSS
jgi:four helix bundle protein